MGCGERGTTPVIVSMIRYCTTLLIDLLQLIIVSFNSLLSTSNYYFLLQLIIVNFNSLLSTSTPYCQLQLMIVNFNSLLSTSTHYCLLQLIIDYFNSLMSTSTHCCQLIVCLLSYQFLPMIGRVVISAISLPPIP